MGAPDSGGPEGAVGGALAVLAGGTAVDFARVEPILEVLGSNVVRVGGRGTGHAVRVINQLITCLRIDVDAEGLIPAERAGIDPRRVQQALNAECI